MNARSARAVTTYRVVTIALAVLAVADGEALRTSLGPPLGPSGALQSQITRLNTDRNGTAAARKQQGQESAATRRSIQLLMGRALPDRRRLSLRQPR